MKGKEQYTKEKMALIFVRKQREKQARTLKYKQ